MTKKYVIALSVMALFTGSISSSTAGANGVVVAAPAGGTSVGTGIWVAGGIAGVATFLAIYDLSRRTTCLGDVFQFGGPGFDRRVMPIDNVIPPPRCRRR